MPDSLIYGMNQRVLLKPKSDIQLIIDILTGKIDPDSSDGNGFLWCGQ